MSNRKPNKRSTRRDGGSLSPAMLAAEAELRRLKKEVEALLEEEAKQSKANKRRESDCRALVAKLWQSTTLK